jgi:ADP-ribose pyrophosphatase YjhB (NUDIX family)
MDRHFTVSIFIVHKDKVLLHVHKKAKKLLPLGGHIESNELPEEACIREVKEESGLKINLYNSQDERLKNACSLAGERLLVNPFYTILNEINLEHYHIDFVYYATAESFDLIPGAGESNLLRWYNKEDLNNTNDIQANILNMANEALDILSTR